MYIYIHIYIYIYIYIYIFKIIFIPSKLNHLSNSHYKCDNNTIYIYYGMHSDKILHNWEIGLKHMYYVMLIK